jgi:hypothetical protein
MHVPEHLLTHTSREEKAENRQLAALKEELANHQNPFEDDDQAGEDVLVDDGGNFIYGTSGVMQSEGGENQEYRQDTIEFFDDQNRYYDN